MPRVFAISSRLSVFIVLVDCFFDRVISVTKSAANNVVTDRSDRR